MSDRGDRTPRKRNVLSKFGQQRLREIASQRGEPASRNQVVAYYSGWVTALAQVEFGLAFLLTLVIGGIQLILGDVGAVDWAILLVVYFVTALVCGWLSDQAFEASGVEP